MSSAAWFPPWRPATSSSWTIYAPTKSPVCVMRSKRPEPSCSYLPPYSPDLNPIEQLFAKLKALLRKAAERTIASLWAAIGRVLEDFPADECSRYLAQCRIRLDLRWKAL